MFQSDFCPGFELYFTGRTVQNIVRIQFEGAAVPPEGVEGVALHVCVLCACACARVHVSVRVHVYVSVEARWKARALSAWPHRPLWQADWVL